MESVLIKIIVLYTSYHVVKASWHGAEASAQEARDMCDAINDNLARLEPKVQGYTSHGDPAVARRKLAGLKPIFPINKPFYGDKIPSRIVNMNLPDELLEQVLTDAVTVKALEKEVLKAADMNVIGYNPFSLEFDNAVLAHPSCAKFIDLNRDLVQFIFPENDGCSCNVFTTTSHNTTYGFHHASQIGIEVGFLGNRDIFTKKQMSFHMALTPTNISANPFTVFENHVPTVFNRDHIIQWALKNYESMPKYRADLLMLALSAWNFRIRYPHTAYRNERTIMDYTDNVYLWATECMNKKISNNGTFWNLEPGQAIHFNNWRMHSDNGLGTDEYKRVTMDLRCYSEIKPPFPYSKYFDLIQSIVPSLAINFAETAKCIPKIFNFDLHEQISLDFGFAVGNVALGFTGKLYEPEYRDIMNQYWSAVRHAHDTKTYNITAFTVCANKIKNLVEDPISVDLSLFIPSSVRMKNNFRLFVFLLTVFFSSPFRALCFCGSFFGITMIILMTLKGKTKTA
mmetsp:Transcript_10534/g.15901  ORF Transcript_10534/g.15901 Transcript_10534/m.15901 type:complete len:512 (+) Transcript_10534:84-1619(+)